jgi:hypothetical protein
MPAHSRFTSPSPGMASPAGFVEERRPFRLPPPARETSMPACMPRSFPSRLSDPCSTPMGRPSRVRTPDTPARPATTSRPAPISLAEAGSAPCQPHVSSAVWMSMSSALRSFFQRMLPRGSAILPVRSNRSPERIFPATRPASRPSGPISPGSQRRSSARSISVHSAVTSTVSGMARRAGAGDDREPFSTPPPARWNSSPARTPCSPPSRLSEPFCTATPYFSAVTVPCALALPAKAGRSPAARRNWTLPALVPVTRTSVSQGFTLARFIPFHAARMEPLSGSPVSSPAISIRSGCTPIRTRGARVIRPAATVSAAGAARVHGPARSRPEKRTISPCQDPRS